MIDLHTHTHYSDGKYAPAEVIHAAVERGITTIANTDHDNGNGSRSVAKVAAQAGIELIPGIEMTTRWPGAKLSAQDANVDLLGYFVHLDDPVFHAYEVALINDLHDRIDAACRRLTKAGYPIRIENVLAENPRYGGTMSLINALLKRRLADDWDHAFELLDACWLPGRETPFTIRAAIEQVHLAGGAAVLAHPSIVRPEGEQMTERWLKQLVDWGLDGIEIYHYRLKEADRIHFLVLARKFGLLVTGGSDFHGWGRGFEILGREPVTVEMVERLRERAGCI